MSKAKCKELQLIGEAGEENESSSKHEISIDVSESEV